MSQSDRTILIRMRAEMQQYIQQTEAARRSTESLGKSQDEAARKAAEAERKQREAAKRTAEIHRQTGAVLVGVGAAITAAGVSALRTGIAYNQLQQQSRAALTTILGSAEAANEQMDRLDEFARNSPFSKQVFITAQQQMLAFGIEAKKVVPYLDAIQNAVAAAGGSNQQLQEVAFVLSQISAAGKITAEDLMQLGQRGIDAATLIGSQMGRTGAQIRADITNGTLGADQALDALTKGMEQRFGGAADNVKQTFSGATDRVRAAWRDLSSELAEPLVGKNSGGLAVSGLNQVADFLREIQGLPGPAKAGAAGLTALVGAGSLAAGTFLLMAPRIVRTREAMATLSTTMPRTTRGITAAGKAAGVAAAAITGLSIAGSLAFNSEAGSGIETFKRGILGLSEGSQELDKTLNDAQWDTRLISGLDGLAGTIHDADRATSGLNRTLGAIGLNAFEDSAADVEQYDAALASLVQSNRIDEAAKGAEYFYEQAKAGNVPLDRARKMLGQYNDALAGLENNQDAAGEATAGATQQTQAQVKAQQEAAEQLAKYRGEIRDSARAWIDFASASKDGKRSLRETIKELEENLEAQQRWSRNLSRIARRGGSQDLLDSLREMGPQGARYVKALADGSQKDIRRLNRIFSGSARNASDLAEKLTDLGDRKPKPKVQVLGVPKARRDTDLLQRYLSDRLEQPFLSKLGLTGVPEAKRSASEFSGFITDALNKIPDEPVNIELSTKARAIVDAFPGFLQPIAAGAAKRATGGAIFGPGTGTSDSIPAWLSNNEHVITDAEVRAAGKGSSQRGHRVIEAIRRMILRGELGRMGDAPAFASGGAVLAASGSAGGAFGTIAAQVAAVASAVGAGLGSAFSRFLTATPAAGQLGPGGTLTPAQVIRGQAFVKSQAGKPYGWGMVGPGAYDCSGLISAATNAALGTALHVRRGATGSMPWPGFAGGLGGSLDVGWFTGNPGHTAGTLGGVNIESSGGVGVRYGGPRGARDGMFNRHMHMADGGFVSGPGGPRDDRIHAMLSDGEFVVNAASTSHFLPLLETINGYASGGKVTGAERKQLASAAKEFRITVSMDTSEVRAELRDLLRSTRQAVGKDSATYRQLDRMGDRLLRVSKALDSNRDQIEAERDKRRSLGEDLASYRDGIVSNLTNDAFTGGLRDFDTQVSADTNDANKRKRLQAQLKRLGLGGKNDKGGLADDVYANASNEFLAELVRSGRGGIRRREQAYAARETTVASVAQQAGTMTSIQRGITQSDRTIRRLNRLIERQERVLKNLPKDMRDGARGIATDARRNR